MKGLPEAATLLAAARAAGRRVCIVADYDCDGATACALLLRGLARLGFAQEQLGYVVPDRAVHGYGLTPAIVDLALAQRPDLLITVDNGIASLEGVAHAKARGLQVIVTDHHLCAQDGDGQVLLPPADAIVNPNQPGCGFASKALAGCGVAFYLLLALRAELRKTEPQQPALDGLLDLVALGTVADVVPLDANNRRLVAQGLKRIRAGQLQPGLRALFQVAGRDPASAGSADFGFLLGPRINAAGRLTDMRLGIECLRCDDASQALVLAQQLDAINRERREVEAGMRERAEELLGRLSFDDAPCALALFDEEFHEGVVGILAGRVKESLHRPTFVFARGGDGRLKGSGRSIPGVHLRDALDLVAKREPGLLVKFGGHAMAAGCTLSEGASVELFAAALRLAVSELAGEAPLTRTLRHDGALDGAAFSCAQIAELEAQVWGQGFEAPLFLDRFAVMEQRLVGSGHLKLRLRHPSGVVVDGIWFRRDQPVSEDALLAYRVAVDRFNGRERVQVLVEDLAG
jgi:single-stranded-DNA-specific exonuclease